MDGMEMSMIQIELAIVSIALVSLCALIAKAMWSERVSEYQRAGREHELERTVQDLTQRLEAVEGVVWEEEPERTKFEPHSVSEENADFVGNLEFMAAAGEYELRWPDPLHGPVNLQDEFA